MIWEWFFFIYCHLLAEECNDARNVLRSQSCHFFQKGKKRPNDHFALGSSKLLPLSVSLNSVYLFIYLFIYLMSTLRIVCFLTNDGLNKMEP